MTEKTILEGEVLTKEEAEDEGKSFLDRIKELTQTKQVEAVTKGREFYTVDHNLQPKLAGHTQFIDFDGGKAKGLVFIAPDNKQYSLGNPSRRQTHHTIVNHPQVLQPIKEQGFEVANLVHNRGGVGLFALFKHPEITLPDTMTWDNEALMDGSSRGDNGLLHLSIAAWLDARTGKSIRLAVGFFRNICSNGLVSSVLGLGHLRLTHNQFSLPKIQQFAERAVGREADLELQTFSPKVLEYPMKMLDLYQRDETVIETMPEFVRRPFASGLAHLPIWGQDEILYQMNLAMDSQNDLSTLDVLNMLTNVSNASENDSLLFRLESISEAFVQLLEVSAFKMNLEFPNIVTNVNTR